MQSDQQSEMNASSQASFIETQFPVAAMSRESFAERNAGVSQTLTMLGKWWGRKPLVLVRACILGLLLPSTISQEQDRGIFLRLMTMDPEARWLRCLANGKMSAKTVWPYLNDAERRAVFTSDSTNEASRWKKSQDLDATAKERAMRLAFERMHPEAQHEVMLRPEQMPGPTTESWKIINHHCGTTASTLAEWVQQMGQRRLGHIPKVGDVFSGSGAIPFEAARIGCNAFASDLNPVAALLTWGGLHLIGGSGVTARTVESAQRKVFDAVDCKITQWGIEHHEKKCSWDGKPWRADCHLYCSETTCPTCGWAVPLSPTWVIAERQRVAILVAQPATRSFGIDIIDASSHEEMQAARDAGTVRDSAMFCPNSSCRAYNQPLPLVDLRRTMRFWKKDDLNPRSDDTFRERLYCVRWIERSREERAGGEDIEIEKKHYLAVSAADLNREATVSKLVGERFQLWIESGIIPRRSIEPGDKTDEPIRTRGWTHWHHLFNSRQLLILGLLGSEAANLHGEALAGVLLSIGRVADFNSKLSRWNPQYKNDAVKQVFTNQALNTLLNFGARGLAYCRDKFVFNWPAVNPVHGNVLVNVSDARDVEDTCDFWITDPPYADAVSYHEITEYFLAWYEAHLPRVNSQWITDSRRPLAIKGSGADFRRAMAQVYCNLAAHMPDEGMQVVMFTHQDPSVWADLAIILWSSGLRVSAAWCIITETQSALDQGNFVQGTVLLVLRKRTGQATAYLEDLLVPVEEEVRRQLDSMRLMDDRASPMFADSDYQLAAYAAALRVLTQYASVSGIDIEREMHREGGENPVTRFIDEAVRLVADALVPSGLDESVWKGLGQEERFYLKALQTEKAGNQKIAVYQELARGFGCHDYKGLLASTKANAARLKTATEFGERLLGKPGDAGFTGSLTRYLLMAMRIVTEKSQPEAGSMFLRSAYGAAWWNHRQNAISILDLLKTQAISCAEWQTDSQAADTLAQFLRVSGGA